MVEFFLGVVKNRVEDSENNITKEDFIILADIPGIAEDVKAFPTKDNLDEPKVGDQVLLTSYDSFYHSYFTYRKLKENDFIGFRAAGKMIDITPDKITIGVFDESNDSYKDNERPDCSKYCSIEMDKDGNITIHAQNNLTINIEGHASINVTGHSDTIVQGDCNIVSKSKMTIQGMPNIQLNTGSNGPLVNKSALNTILTQLSNSIDTNPYTSLKSSPVVTPIMNSSLYDNNITH